MGAIYICIYISHWVPHRSKDIHKLIYIYIYIYICGCVWCVWCVYVCVWMRMHVSMNDLFGSVWFICYFF